IIEAVESLIPVGKNDDSSADISYEGGKDTDYVERAIELGVRNGQLSTSMLQRKLKLGFARAARIMDELEEMGVIGPSEGAKPRKVLMSQMQYDARRANMQD
ncbi:MAG: DNA translocase FtsK, partial [Huintestinicola sp.]